MKTLLDSDEYLSADDLADQLGITTATLSRWHTSGDAPAAVMIGRKRYYRREAVRTWLLARERGGPRNAQ